MYSYVFDKKTGGYLLTTQTGKYVASEIRPVFAPELSLTGLGAYFEYDHHETRPLMWGMKNTYLIADVDDKGEPCGRKVAQLNNTQYGKPLNIQVFFDGKMKLDPVDVDAMVTANAKIMDIVVADAKRRTKELYDESIKRCDIAYIAFSGGKDSVALLDICHRVLPLSVPVVFSDTDMELPDTYKVVDEIKQKYPDREFITAKAETSALENWRIFAPPSRTIRWCCSVHKSTPALMCLKKKLRKSAIKVMAFVGVRGDESYSRSFYEDASDGAKNASQLNRMPILDWGAHELWLYIFANNLIINCAYKKGISRVGCVLCPESAGRYMWFAQKAYPQVVKTYGDIIIGTSTKRFATADVNPIFRDSALLQRIHGFIPGQFVPALSPGMFINDWALNSEYFTEIMHLLRSTPETMKYRGMVEELVEVKSASGETSGREKEAVYRLCTAYLKLFFPHADSTLIRTQKFKQEFDKYCLTPAKSMQETVLKQMRFVNPGMFPDGNLGFSTYTVRWEL